jgi:hypothetical protein
MQEGLRGYVIGRAVDELLHCNEEKYRGLWQHLCDIPKQENAQEQKAEQAVTSFYRQKKRSTMKLLPPLPQWQFI